MASLHAQIAEECRVAGERREAARSLKFCALEQLEARQVKFDCILVERDPCPLCGVRGDLGCEHRQPVSALPFAAFERNPPRRSPRIVR